MLFVASLGASLSAQNLVTDKPGRQIAFEKNGFFDNWFVGVGAGANWHISKQFDKGPFFKKPTLTGNLQVGKWINPIWGGRILGTYGKLHTFSGPGDREMATQQLWNVQADVLFDATNYFMNYSSDRMYHFIAFGGAGYAQANVAKLHGKYFGGLQRFVTVNAGFINRFQLTQALAVDLEVGAAVIPNDVKRFDELKRRYNGLVNTAVNVVYNFGNSANSATAAFYAESEGYTGKTYGFVPAGALDQALLDNLNGEINRLRQRNALLEKRPEKCPECPKLPTVSAVSPASADFLTNVVRFNINSAVIQPQEQVSVYTTAEYLKGNPKAKVRVVGYADKGTGTAAYNEKLSEKRAKNVANELIKKYGISSDRVIVEWKGSSVQPYPQNNNWNRVVIFYAD